MPALSASFRFLSRRVGAFTILLCALAAYAQAQAAGPQRVVSLGGPLTEIAFALGGGDRLVGVDASSVYPAAAAQLPKVGYYRSFSVEGVVSLQPQVVLALDHAGPPPAMEQLRKLGVQVVVLPSDPTLDALELRMDGVARALGLGDAGKRAALALRDEITKLTRAQSTQRVLLVSAHTGKLQAAGRGTAANALLRLTGARNAFDGEGYKSLSGEAVAALQPDVIVTTTLSAEASGGVQGFAAQPGLAVTPAARERRIIVMDDLLLLGFGPRLPEAVRLLQAGLAKR
ncbi:heme/hemin ABC transporter substrate-binding protein [Uliginosibacterium sp. H1]|uniref:heme/hemin ABC transporter substrate-binding protein n=1 Tax=Uliginosibacterium sp. H1 TaxID=3114757 RepID=UPI002E18E30D|nr:ABC transporter substrate-binding protein [Uliginosibacterium sp. H1]